jgi:hypothetical protein
MSNNDNNNDNNHKTHTVGKIHSVNCGHCIDFAPKWNNMKEMLKTGGNHHINIVEFETTDDANKLQDFNDDLQKKYGKQLEYSGVPTMFKISGGGSGEIEYYEGERHPENMTKWVLAKNGGGKKKKRRINTKLKKNKKRTRTRRQPRKNILL